MRDYFAAAALPDVLGHYNWDSDQIQEAAQWCYKLADAMLKARQGRTP